MPQNVIEDKSNQVALEESIFIEESIPVTVSDENSSPKRSKPMVIVYTLEQVRKKAPEAVASINDLPDRKTGLKKALEIAGDVRTGDSPLGGLRQAKNEILAFNFKKEDRNNK